MSLKKALESLPEQPRATDTTLYFGDEPLAFREPNTTDLNPDNSRLEKLRVNFPGLQPSLRMTVMLFTNCYRSTPDDNGLDFDLIFAQMAVKNERAFDSLAEQFAAAFPEWSNWLNAKITAKNDSGALSKETPSTTA